MEIFIPVYISFADTNYGSVAITHTKWYLQTQKTLSGFHRCNPAVPAIGSIALRLLF